MTSSSSSYTTDTHQPRRYAEAVTSSSSSLLLQSSGHRTTATTRPTARRMLQQQHHQQQLLPVVILIVTIIIQLLQNHVQGLPNGAPVCTVGEAAPQVLHLDPQRNPQLGSIADGGYYIEIGNTRLTDPNRIYNFFAYRDYTMTISSDINQSYKGVLVVLSRIGSDLNGELFLNSNQTVLLQQSVCDSGRVAVTHLDPEFKKSTSATINFQNNYDIVSVDVNIVLINDELSSIFFYNQFKLRVSGATDAPTPVPRPTCGLFRLSIFCLPKITFCGFLGRLLGQDQRHCIKRGQLFAYEDD